MHNQRVTLITLGVSDLAASRAFYERLGWDAHARSMDEVVFFQIHGAVLGLFGREALAEDQGRPGAPLGTGAMAGNGYVELKKEEVHSDCLLTKLRELAVVAHKMNKFE